MNGTLVGTLRRIASAVLFDRDGTLIVDCPLNTDPSRVTPMPYARRALDRLRSAGIPTAVITNQSAIAHGLLRVEDVEATNAAAEKVLGPLGPICICPHAEDRGCACRKPAPGLVFAAARALGVVAGDCVVVGDIGSDVAAAHAADARAILVPTLRTRRDEIDAAPLVAANVDEAVDRILAGLA